MATDAWWPDGNQDQYAYMIRDASDIPMRALCDAMNAAFYDYPIPMRLSQGGFDLMMRVRGLSREHSRLAFDGDRVSAFWLMGARHSRAYLISSGTLPAHRRQGLSKSLGRAVIANLTSVGFRTLQTEVLEHNTSARALYEKLGFREHRALDSFALEAVPSCATVPHVIQNARINDVASAQDFWDSAPSWQNDLASLADAGEDAALFAVRDDAGLAAFAAFVPNTATLVQLAVRKDRRREGLGTALLIHGQRVLGLKTPKIINVDRADTGFTSFLSARGATSLVSQRELALEL